MEIEELGAAGEAVEDVVEAEVLVDCCEDSIVEENSVEHCTLPQQQSRRELFCRAEHVETPLET